MSTAKAQFEAFKVKYAETKKQMIDEAKAAFRGLTQDFFQEFPSVKSFGWTQYTPYFMDGDTCEFSVNSHHDSIYLNGVSDDCGKDRNCDDGYDEVQPDIAEKASKAVSAFLDGFDSQVLQEIFGDHARVTIHSDGRSVTTEYSHD